MSDYKFVLSVVAGLMFFAGFIPYIIAIIGRKIHPKKTSWFIWSGLQVITVLAMISSHSLNGQVVGAALGDLFVVMLVIVYSKEKGFKTLDKLCLAGAVVGILLWKFFNDPVLAIIFAQTTMFLGSLPTYNSAWHEPENEDKLSWTLWSLSSLPAIAAISEWSLAGIFQPLCYLVGNSIMIYLLFVRPKFIRMPR